MIIKFKIFEEYEESEYLLNLDDLWNVYSKHFDELYPTVELYSSDKKKLEIQKGNFFREDILKILKNKEVSFFIKNKEKETYKLRGIITDVWSRINGLWRRFKKIKDNKIKVLSKHKTDLEQKLEIYMTAKKYNL